jgi:excisionase family DNA binding protein
MADHSKLLTTNELAGELGIHPVTLASWRLIDGRGPAFVKLGSSVRYRRADVVAWLSANTHSGTRETANR